MAIVTKILRNGVVENVYTGSYAVVDSLGNVSESAGRFDQPVFMRSTIKPLVLLLLIIEGVHERYELTDRECAVIAGSHMGADYHVEAVRGILGKVKITVDALKCGLHNPFSLAVTERLIRTGEPLSALHHNCSGYHAGLLLLSDHFQVDFNAYYLPGGEIHARLLDLLSNLSGVLPSEVHIGTDDCHVPTYGLPLHKLAEIYARIAASKHSDPSIALLWRIITAHPDMLAGSDTLETDLLLAGKNVLPKIGSGGLYCLALPERESGVAIKVDSNDYRVAEAMAMHILMRLRVVGKADSHLLDRYYYQCQSGLNGECLTHFETHLS